MLLQLTHIFSLSGSEDAAAAAKPPAAKPAVVAAKAAPSGDVSSSTVQCTLKKGVKRKADSTEPVESVVEAAAVSSDQVSYHGYHYVVTIVTMVTLCLLSVP